MLRHVPAVPPGHPPDHLLGLVQLAGAWADMPLFCSYVATTLHTYEPAGGLRYQPPEAQEGEEGEVGHHLQGAPVPGQGWGPRGLT